MAHIALTEVTTPPLPPRALLTSYLASESEGAGGNLGSLGDGCSLRGGGDLGGGAFSDNHGLRVIVSFSSGFGAEEGGETRLSVRIDCAVTGAGESPGNAAGDGLSFNATLGDAHISAIRCASSPGLPTDGFANVLTKGSRLNVLIGTKPEERGLGAITEGRGCSLSVSMPRSVKVKVSSDLCSVGWGYHQVRHLS